jgi:transcriptional regulator with XRE-family HTH domain
MNALGPTHSRARLERRLARLWGRRVAGLRRRHGISQQALGRRCAVTQQTISKVERGEVLPGDGLKVALATALAVSPGELFAWPRNPDRHLATGSVPGGLTDAV